MSVLRRCAESTRFLRGLVVLHPTFTTVHFHFGNTVPSGYVGDKNLSMAVQSFGAIPGDSKVVLLSDTIAGCDAGISCFSPQPVLAEC
jgi:hypothetical protein